MAFMFFGLQLTGELCLTAAFLRVKKLKIGGIKIEQENIRNIRILQNKGNAYRICSFGYCKG